jgi:murein DD-endopeptidase MepM/ murein hydrolase activator NlpD
MELMAKLLFSFLIFISFSLKVQAYESAFSVLLKYGFNENELVTFVKKYPELRSLELASGLNYETPDDNDVSYVEIKLYAENTNEAYVVTRFGNDVSVEKVDVQFNVEVRKFEGEIHKNLFDSVMNEIDSPNTAAQVSDAFQDEFVDTKGLRVKAYYQFQVEHYYEDGQFIKYGNVLSASLIIGKAITKKIYQINPENFSWMLMPENSFGPGEKIFYLPVETKRITSVFQLNRRHPVTRRHQPHNGIDFRAPRGLPVYPALDGVVVTASRTRSKGKYITILHDNGYQTTYCHLKAFAPGIKTGRRVELSEKIGEVGKTGFATGAHLHFAVLEDGYYVNPINLLKGYTYSQRDQQAEIDIGIGEKYIVEGEVSEEVIED